MGVDEVGVDEMGSRRSGTTPILLPIRVYGLTKSIHLAST